MTAKNVNGKEDDTARQTKAPSIESALLQLTIETTKNTESIRAQGDRMESGFQAMGHRMESGFRIANDISSQNVQAIRSLTKMVILVLVVSQVLLFGGRLILSPGQVQVESSTGTP